jgi:predicted transcriptional regulator
LKYRSRTDIVTNILEAAMNGSTKTKIMYNAYLSFAQLKEYLVVIQESGLIEFDKETKTYKTTNKGVEFLKSTEVMTRMFEPLKEK